jgi:hypothetical protein
MTGSATRSVTRIGTEYYRKCPVGRIVNDILDHERVVEIRLRELPFLQFERAGLCKDQLRD